MWIKNIAVAALSLGVAMLLVLGVTRFGGIVTARMFALDLRMLSTVTLGGLAIMLACLLVLRRNKHRGEHRD